MSDPYDLLRRARELVERNKHNSEHAEWLKAYKQLPGATLSKKALRVLKDANLRCTHNQDIVDKLLKDGYLKEVSMMRGSPGHAQSYTSLRRSQKGRDALLLRTDVSVEAG